ncbi:MAG: GNAT family N-acetyltransferase [Candidatus Melainabacteria bacterium]|nr:GNAT family N-acetyltransferase [Candidatus Melainabacteria bacterium]
MTNKLIRELNESDVESFWKLRLRALKEEPESFGASYEESVDMSIEGAANRLQKSDDAFVLGAFNPDLVGMLGLYRRQGLKLRHKGIIWGMYVAPERRGKGLGKALLSAAIERASAIPDLEHLMLSVVTTKEAARKLYLSLGFQIYGVENKALKLGEQLFDEELMSLTLKPSV